MDREQIAAFFKRNSPTILTGVGVGGVIATAVLSGRATLKAAKAIEELEASGELSEEPRVRGKQILKATWPHYIAPTLVGGVTIGCIVGSHRISVNRTAVAVTAYTLGQQALDEYRDKVAELHNEKKEAAIRAAVMEDKLKGFPVPDELVAAAAEDQRKVDAAFENNEVEVLGPRRVRFCEVYTGRYFLCDIETLNQAVNKVNFELVRQNYVSLSYFYGLLGLRTTQISDDVGWTVSNMMEVDTHSFISPDGVPVIAFDYDPLPGPMNFL